MELTHIYDIKICNISPLVDVPTIGAAGEIAAILARNMPFFAQISPFFLTSLA